MNNNAEDVPSSQSTVGNKRKNGAKRGPIGNNFTKELNADGINILRISAKHEVCFLF